MKLCKIDINGQTFRLCLNGAALFDIYDKFGTKGFVTDPIEGHTRKAFNATCWMFAKLAEQGELVRRHQGYDRQEIKMPEYFQTFFRPADVLTAREAIKTAVQVGFAREIPDEEDGEIDLGLQELKKKRNRADPLSVFTDHHPVPRAERPGGPAADGGSGG